MMKTRERPVAECRRKFSRIWGVKTTIQQAIEMDLGRCQQRFGCDWRVQRIIGAEEQGLTNPQMPLRAAMSRLRPDAGGAMMVDGTSTGCSECHR